MHSEEQEAFEDKLAHLNPSRQRLGIRLSNSLLRCFWWFCCCFWFASDPYKPETKEWAVSTTDDHVARPAHLKISTSDKRAVEIKIVYAVNPTVATQLYEVDVFMFFLQDLEAVSNNFYHDLWQAVRLHTPKTPLAALANDPSAGFLDLIEHELQGIQSKQAAGDAVAVQQDVDKVVQQLRLHVCIYRNSVRRALKSIAQAVEQLEATQAGAAETAQVARAVMNVVTQIAQSLHRLQLACTPCQGPEAPEPIRAVWRLVDEYALAESERVTLKLLRGLDKHIQYVQRSASAATADTAAAAAAATAANALSTPAGQQVSSVPGQDAHLQPQHVQSSNTIQPMNGHEQDQYDTTKLSGFNNQPPPNKGFTSAQADLAQEGLDHSSNLSVASVQSAARPQQVVTDGISHSPLPLTSLASQQALSASAEPQPRGAEVHPHHKATDPQQHSIGARLHPHHMAADSQQQPSKTHLQPHHMAADPCRTVTADLPAYLTGSQGTSLSHLEDPSATPLLPPLLLRPSGRREKLEYRLSQDDMYLPSAAELAAVMQQSERSRRRWTADARSHSQHASSSRSASCRLMPSRDAKLKQQQQQQQNSSDNAAVAWTANGHSQHPLIGNTSASVTAAGAKSSNTMQQRGLQKQGGIASSLAIPIAASPDVTAPDEAYANPLFTQRYSSGEHQAERRGDQEQGQLQQPYQLPQQHSNMASLIQMADAAQVLADGVADSSEAKLDSGEWQSKMEALKPARQLVLDAIMQLQDERRQRGYLESILVPNAPSRNEAYTNCIKCLKHNARAAVMLKPELLPQSFLLADLVGMVIAGLAMCIACGAIFVATQFSRNQLSGVYVTIIVVGYMLKDRLKEWGKRYLQPSAMKFGFEFPDRTVKMRDSRGKRVGRCKEWVKVVADKDVDVRVLAMRHKDKGHIPPERHATKPERVLAYRKKMEVAWQQLDPRLRGVDGLDDIMSFDLQHFCRRMQPPDEPHYCLETGPDGSMQVQKVQCARVYHINVVLRIRTSVQDVRKDKAYREKSLQIQRARIIMDQTGIKRLEATDDSVHLMGDRHVISASPAWRPEMRMPSLHLPRVSMPRLSAFGHHSAQPLQPEQQPAALTDLPEHKSPTDRQKALNQV